MGDRPGKGDGRRRRIPSHSVTISSSGPSPPVTTAASPSSPARATAPGLSQHPVPLPPAPNAQRRGSKAGALPRVQHACEPCRRRKAKCDGTKPLCSRCEDQAIVCYYAEGKRDRTKRHTQNFASRIALYESLLQDLFPQQTYARQQDIKRVLDEARDYPVESSMSAAELAGSDEDMDFEGRSAGFAASSPVSQDWFQIDDSRFEESTGFLGKASTVRWIENVGEKILSDTSSSISRTQKEDMAQSSSGFNELLLQTAKYHVRDLDLSGFGPYGEQANQYSVPPKAMADALVQAYFTTLHPFFPIVLGPVFMAQYELFWQSSQPPPDSNLFLAILNLIFALGAVYGHYIHADWGNHLLYFVRSRLLSMEPLPMLHLPTLENIQVASLGGMYLVASHQINRAWHIVGLAIRYAQSRGLHLANDNLGKTKAQQELEARVWHSTCSLERLLGFLTGRTVAVRDKQSNTPYPKTIDDHVAFGESTSPLNVPWFATSTSMTSFCVGLELDKICSAVLSELYSANTALLPWSHVQKLIKQLNDRLGNWRSRLPPTLRIDEGPTPELSVPLGERMYLALRYFSTSMLIHRPCLCINEGGTGTSPIPSQSMESKKLDHASLTQCVASARKLIALLPDEPNLVQLYAAAPWWCVLHYIVQAGAVIIMRISLKPSHVSDEILEDAMKTLRWLKAMGTNCLPAFRAWIALGRLLDVTLPRSGRSISKDLSSLLPEKNLLEMMTAGAEAALYSTYLSTGPSFQPMDPPNIHQPGPHQPQRGWEEHQSNPSITFTEDPNSPFPLFDMPILTPQNFWGPHEPPLSSDWPMADPSSHQMGQDFVPDSYQPPDNN